MSDAERLLEEAARRIDNDAWLRPDDFRSVSNRPFGPTEQQRRKEAARKTARAILSLFAKNFDTSGERVKNPPDSLHVSTCEVSGYVFTTDTALLTGAQPAKLYKLSGAPNHAVLAAHGTVDQMQEMAERLNGETPHA